MMATQPRPFSRREQQIVDLLVQARSIKDIALALDLSANTVKDYAKNIYRKAQVHSARELMLQAAAGSRFPADSETGLAQLLQTAQGLQAEAAPAEALAQLSAAIRRCTPAGHVSFWRWIRVGGELCLASDAGGQRAGACLRPGPFLRRLRDRGWARLEPDEIAGAEARQFVLNGLPGEVIGVKCSPSLGVNAVLAGDATAGRFGPLDAATIRLLTRLAYAADDSNDVRMLA
jgi:DNA-binding CsgD family transcriptional regulator